MRAVLFGLVVAVGTASAQPAPDVERAKQLYIQATAEMKDGRFADAAKDFGAVYDLTHDPVIFYKIGAANQKAGNCAIAVVYYKRYLRDAHPTDQFQQLAQDKIKECGGDKTAPPSPAPTPTPAPAPPAPPAPAPAASPPAPPPSLPPPPPIHRSAQNNGAWILVGTSLAMITIGSVLAYSASSSENDLQDLYIAQNGVPPTYDAKTAQRYQDLVDQGRLYEHLSWASFGVGAAAAVGATILFLRDKDREERISVAPVVTPHSQGVAATLRF
jgi:hypothetical protein